MTSLRDPISKRVKVEIQLKGTYQSSAKCLDPYVLSVSVQSLKASSPSKSTTCSVVRAASSSSNPSALRARRSPFAEAAFKRACRSRRRGVSAAATETRIERGTAESVAPMNWRDIGRDRVSFDEETKNGINQDRLRECDGLTWLSGKVG